MMDQSTFGWISRTGTAVMIATLLTAVAVESLQAASATPFSPRSTATSRC